MLYAIGLSNIIQLYFIVKSIHGVYISYQFLAWLIVSIYSGFFWIIDYIPKPLLQIGYKEAYYEIDTGDYIEIKKY